MLELNQEYEDIEPVERVARLLESRPASTVSRLVAHPGG